ncbi:MAG: chitobiase/beta-hexosaminidase C-terminal domain-containing protein [Phycisphaerae bacterium]|nr:chitobiase/beta-hexosaminidase C-terminal domain-containing protein [Phycisphaerae bacterium]
MTRNHTGRRTPRTTLTRTWTALLAAVLLAAPSACAAEPPVPTASGADSTAGDGLRLDPIVLRLKDGTQVPGFRAFDMDDRHIVYSPRFATVRSFLKADVRAVTPSTREKVTAMRTGFWADEPPAEGHTPAYTTETWEAPKRLIVWARPGETGRFGEPANWLDNGKPMTSLSQTEVWSGPAWGRSKGVTALDPETDVLIPAAADSYQVRGRGGTYMARHITVERNAFLGHGIKGAYGNLWVADSARIDGGGHAALRGVKHTFFVNGSRRDPAEPGRGVCPIDWQTISAKGFARKWEVRKDARDASMELIGSVRSGDETHVIRGRVIVSEDTTVLIGARCCQSVRREGTLQLTSGAVVAKHSNQLHKQDMMIVGTLLAGTPDRPLERDCTIGISFKDHETLFAGRMWTEVGKRVDFRGFEVVPTGKVRVHSTDPTKARLVFCCHRQDGAGDSGNLPNPEKDPEKWAAYEALPRRINLVFWKGADVQLDGVVFEDIEAGGIKLADMSMKDAWKNVFFGDNNAGPPSELYQQYEPTLEGRGAYSYPIETAARGEEFTSNGLFTKRPGTPIIATPDGWYPKGHTVRVRMSNEMKELDIRYTLDGEKPSGDARLYDGPIAVSDDAVITAASFKDGKQYGETARAEFTFVAADAVEKAASVDPGATSAGLAYAYYEGKWKDIPDLDAMTPARTGTADGLDPNALNKGRDGFAVVFDGYIAIPESGVYTVSVSTAKEDACRVAIAGKRVVDNDVKHLRGIGLIGLEAGKHPLKVTFVDKGWREQLRLRLRKLDATKEQDVTAEMLSH